MNNLSLIIPPWAKYSAVTKYGTLMLFEEKPYLGKTLWKDAWTADDYVADPSNPFPTSRTVGVISREHLEIGEDKNWKESLQELQ